MSFIHEHEFIHGNLTPTNILIKFEKTDLCVKISDFSMSRAIKDDETFKISNIGTWGWQAPAEKNVEIGDHNISLIRRIPEAYTLVDLLLNSSQILELNDIGEHPFFWIFEKRIRFLCIASDRVKMAKRNQNQDAASKVIVKYFDDYYNQFIYEGWRNSIDMMIISYIESKKYVYQYFEFSELLRLFRNLSTHYIELPPLIKSLFDGRPDGILEYFGDKFPRFYWENFQIMKTLLKVTL